MCDSLTLRLTLSYDGTDFHGWQLQPGLPTIQQALTDAVLAVTGQRVVIHGSGRTDAGVHALAQVAHCELRAGLPISHLPRALNARLPPSIRVTAAVQAPPGFHARRCATGKLYRYRIFRGPVCSPFLRLYALHYPYPLDEGAMIAAAPDFIGEHDFRSFATAPEGGEPRLETTVRLIRDSTLQRQGDELVYEVDGSGFLRHMVRNMVGYLLAIGRHRRSRSDLPQVLAARSRRAADGAAPACGLYLVRVDYADPHIL